MVISEAPQRETRQTTCPLDCPDACSLEVHLENGRAVKLTGDRRNPVTDGFICGKVGRFARHVYGPRRLLYPGVRDGAKGEGVFRRVSWDEALQRIAHRIEETRATHGAEAILPLSYGGCNGYLTQGVADDRLFFRLGASRLARTVCSETTTEAERSLYGRMAGVAPEDFVHARLVVLWGANPSITGIHLVPFLQEARRQGARLVVVDPRATPLAKQADLHLAIRPGTDLPVALAVIRWLFTEGAADLAFLGAHARGADELRRRAEPWTVERAAAEADVPAAAIAELARLYAASSPAVVRCGWGTERNRNGGSAVAAVLALPAIAGKFGRRGGGYTLSNATAWRIDTAAATGAEPPPTRKLNMNRVGRYLQGDAKPPIDLLFVYNCNPLATLPEQGRVRAGLRREDLFTVVFEQVMTDTARYADVVLPATTFLEHHDMRKSYGSITLLEARPVIAPLGEARPNYDVFVDLCHRLGLARAGDAESPDEIRDAVLASTGRGPELAASLDREGLARPARNPVQFVDVFPGTADGKIDLLPEALDRGAPSGLYGYQPDPATASFPLALISPATSRTITSSLGELHDERIPLEIHPGDAAPRGIRAGDLVRVWNDLGELRCPARLNRDLRPGVVLLPKGMWGHQGSGGATCNSLVPDSLSDVAGGACFNDTRVEVALAAHSGAGG